MNHVLWLWGRTVELRAPARGFPAYLHGLVPLREPDSLHLLTHSAFQQLLWEKTKPDWKEESWGPKAQQGGFVGAGSRGTWK